MPLTQGGVVDAAEALALRLGQRREPGSDVVALSVGAAASALIDRPLVELPGRRAAVKVARASTGSRLSYRAALDE